MALRGGENFNAHEPAPVTLPALNLPAIDTEADRRAMAIEIAKRKTIRAGIDAYAAVQKAESFENWLLVGKALLIGKAHALRVTGANRPWGATYSREFGQWMKSHNFGHMPAPTRSVAVELAEHADQITEWRNSLPERQRKHLIHPLSVTRRWRATTQPNGKSAQDLRRDALAGWRRFISCVQALPAD
jgi:hypothetical protein